jgi:hypothetical protein
MEFEGEDFKLEFLRMDVDVSPRISFIEFFFQIAGFL